MTYYRDLRDYLTALDKVGKLRVVNRLINKDTELHPLVRCQFRGLKEPERTGFLFENLTDLNGRVYRCKVATSIIAPSVDVYALGLKCEKDQIHHRWMEAYQRPFPPRLIERGPVKEEIHLGKNLLEHEGLTEFPIPMATNGWESIPRLTAVSWHTRDPETGVINVGTYNGTLLGELYTSCRAVRGSHLRIHWDKCRQRGVPLQAAAVVGTVPVLLMASVVKVPYGISELDTAGGLAGEPLELVKCETVDIEVPASAEIVIEGEIPTEYMEPDAASGEHTGYTIIDHMVFGFRVTCITHRRSPIWHDFISQMPPSESSTLRIISGEGRMLNFLRNNCGILEVKDVALHHCAGAWRMCVIRMQDVGGVRTHNSVVWQALTSSLSISTEWPKIVVAVDEDIDPRDLESVFWAICFRFQPHRDTKIIQGRSAGFDQSSGPFHLTNEERAFPSGRTGPQGASAILVDATRKWDYTPISLPKKDYMVRAEEIWEELGLPRLEPREPWYGVSLGIWPEKYQRQAELAEKGAFDEIAKELMSGRKKM